MRLHQQPPAGAEGAGEPGDRASPEAAAVGASSSDAPLPPTTAGALSTAQCVAKYEAAMRSPGCAEASAAGACTSACEAAAAAIPAECGADRVLAQLALEHAGLVADM